MTSTTSCAFSNGKRLALCGHRDAKMPTRRFNVRRLPLFAENLCKPIATASFRLIRAGDHRLPTQLSTKIVNYFLRHWPGLPLGRRGAACRRWPGLPGRGLPARQRSREGFVSCSIFKALLGQCPTALPAGARLSGRRHGSESRGNRSRSPFGPVRRRFAGQQGPRGDPGYQQPGEVQLARLSGHRASTRRAAPAAVRPRTGGVA